MAFPGIQGVKLEYYTNVTGWKTVPGGLFYESATFVIPPADRATFGSTTIRAVKNGMYYSQAFTLAELAPVNYVNVPVKVISVDGIGSACSLAIVQNDWVYNWTPAVVGGTHYFNVFDNGRAYEVRLLKDGFYAIIATNVLTDVFFGPKYFYQIDIPAGVTNLRMQSNNWIYNKSGAADPKIALLRDYGKERSASMTFNYNGAAYSMPFTLNGTNPFDALP